MHDNIAMTFSVPQLAVLNVALNQSQQNDYTEQLLTPDKASASPPRPPMSC